MSIEDANIFSTTKIKIIIRSDRRSNHLIAKSLIKAQAIIPKRASYTVA